MTLIIRQLFREFILQTDRIKVRLSVYDNEGNIDIKEVRVVFDEEEELLGANFLRAINQKQIPAIVVSLVLFAIVSLSLYFHSLKLEEVSLKDIDSSASNKKRTKK